MFNKLLQRLFPAARRGDKREGQAGQPAEERLSRSLTENLAVLRFFLGDSSDVVIREFRIGPDNLPGALLYVEGLVDTVAVNEHLLKSLMLDYTGIFDRGGEDGAGRWEAVKRHGLTAGNVREEDTYDRIIMMALEGQAVLLIEGETRALVVDVRGGQWRSIEEPVSEPVILGPRAGFVENIQTNVAMLRRRVKDPNLVVKITRVGRRSKTDVAITYIKGLAPDQLVQEVEKRVGQVDVDDILDSGYLKQLIEDNYLSPFPQLQITERPDKVVAGLIEGRAALLVNGTPFAIIAPATLNLFYQSPEDYYERWWIGSFTRMMRYLGTFVATFTPGIYIALTSFHPGMIPTKLALSIAQARAGIPFPAFIEAFLMEASIELFREAGARLPKTIGPTVSIVGGLVIGDAAVRAGLVSPAMVIVVALTAISSFTVPHYGVANSFRLLRFPVMVAAAVLGLYGVVLSFIFINIHLVTLMSFGYNFLSPTVPYSPGDWKDMFFRLPPKFMVRRPDFLKPQDPVRQGKRKGGGSGA